MSQHYILVPFALVVGLTVLVWSFASIFSPVSQSSVAITNFEECAAAGFPVMESYPRQCNANGEHFVEDIKLPDDQNGGLGLQANGCAVAGCSGQLCVSANEAGTIYSTCEYRAEYACYREASCEPQADGQCGWTQTNELTQCLVDPPAEEPTDAQVQ